MMRCKVKELISVSCLPVNSSIQRTVWCPAELYIQEMEDTITLKFNSELYAVLNTIDD